MRFSFPSTEGEWRETVADFGLQGESLHTMGQMGSGSNVSIRQFLMLRILYKNHSPNEFDAQVWGFKDELEKADNLLHRDFQAFENYLRSIREKRGSTAKGASDPLPLGIFEMPRYHQLCVQDVGTRASLKVSPYDPSRAAAWKPVPTSDEVIVNFAIIDFLQAVCLKVPEVSCNWIGSCYSFKAQFGASGYEARTDGVLHMKEEDNKVHALVECKAETKKRALPGVQFQEAAQIAAWIMQPNHPEIAAVGRVFLVSQDRTEIFLTLGTVDRHYRNYLLNKSQAIRFLKLHHYGPFDTSDDEDMKTLASIVLAFSLKVSNG